MVASRRRYKFDPFDLSSAPDHETKRIKFERLQSHVKTKPLWLLLAIFILVLFIYIYLKSSVF